MTRTMTRKKARRIQMLALGAVLLAASATLVSFAFRDSIVFFFSPTELMTHAHRPDQLLRVGGLVEKGSLVRGEGDTERFVVTDGKTTVPVAYTGILPDLFAEGQGVVAEGHYRNGTFQATQVLAKHDAKYMPKNVVEALKKEGHWQGEKGVASAE